MDLDVLAEKVAARLRPDLEPLLHRPSMLGTILGEAANLVEGVQPPEARPVQVPVCRRP